SASAIRGFDNQRKADSRCDGFGLLRSGYCRFSPWHTRDTGRFCEPPRRRLIAEKLQQFGAGADEGNSRPFAGTRQRRIFGEESVAGMNRVDLLLFRQRYDAFDIEVGLYRSFALADQVSLVGFEAMQREPVFLGIDGDGAKPELIGRAQDTYRDFAAI